MVLSEAVYKVVDFGDAGAADMLAAIVRSFPPSLLTVRRVQWAQPHAHHRRAWPLCPGCERGACPGHQVDLLRKWPPVQQTHTL